MASVTMIASDRLWLKSTHGFSLTELPRKGTFADHVGELNDPTDMFVVLDAQKFEKYSEYPPVKNPPHIRFYAGTPIVVEGHIVGSLCVFDPQPRTRLSVTERMNLLDLAHATSILLTERRNRVISKTSAVDRLVSHLLHDSLSIPLQEMTSTLSKLNPNLSMSSSNRPSRAPSIDCTQSVEMRKQGVSESLLQQSRSLLNHDNDFLEVSCCGSENQVSTAVSNAANTYDNLSPSHSDSIQDVFVALCQLSSLIGSRSSNQNTPRSSGKDTELNSPKSMANQRIQVPLRYTESTNSNEYLDERNEDIIESAPFVNQNICFGNLRSSGSSSVATLPSRTPLQGSDPSQHIQRLPTFTNYVYSNMSSELNEMLSYLQQVLPVSVSNFRTVWNLSLPKDVFQNPQCSQVKCIIYLMDVLTNILETVMTHIIMRAKQLEVTVTMDILSTKNDIKEEYQPNESKGYLLNETAILPTELFLSMKATDFMNTFYGGHVTVEPKHEITVSVPNEGKNETQNDENRKAEYDFFIDNVAIQEILSPLGVRTTWKLQGNSDTVVPQITGNGQGAFDGTTGMLIYEVVVPCRLEMTYLPPEEIEKVKEKLPVGENIAPADQSPAVESTQIEQKNETPVEPFVNVSNVVAKAPSEPALKTKLKVLVVDDSPAIQKILGKWLQRNDCEVTSALNGQLGVEALQTSQPPFDLVFMDFLMPVMDGLEAVRTFFSWKSQSSPEVIARYEQTMIIGLSATANVDEQQEGLKVGMNYFIQKPADTKLLRVIIDWKLQQQDVEEISKKLFAGVALS